MKEFVMDDDTTGMERDRIAPDDIRAHAEHDHIAAVFADRDHATGAVEELRALGLGSEHLGIAVHGADAVVFEHDERAELVHDTEVGLLAGAPLGAIAGIGIAALAVPGIGMIGAGGTLAIAGASALWGALLGAYTGAAKGEAGWEAHEDLSYTALDPGEVLVVVCSHGHADAVHAVMREHDGQLRPVAGAPR
jgi:hypothetical protein